MTHSEYPAFRRIFLQWLVSERLVEFERANSIFKALIEGIDFTENEENEDGSAKSIIDHIHSTEFDVFLDFCKKSLNPIGFSLKKQIFVLPDRKKEYIGICNIKSDGIAQIATKLTAEQLNFFKKMIILTKRCPTHEFTFIELEMELKAPKLMLQNLLADLIENNWIYLDASSGLHSLGPRSIIELPDFLKEEDEENIVSREMNRFEECGLCSSLISAGSSAKCSNIECGTSFHDLCMKDFAETMAKLECPKCKKKIQNE